MGLRAVLEAALIPLKPGQYRVRTSQSTQSLGNHRAVIGVPTDQIGTGAV
jgi:hypothetical protein